MQLTRRQLQNLKLAVAANVHGELVRAPKYRDNPMEAARVARKHADSAVAVGQRGYPVGSYRGKAVRLHRLMLTLFVRPLKQGEIGMHKCDNPPCWNPDHLKIGTYTENMRDCSKKGRADEQWKTHCKRGHPLSGDNLLWVPRKGTDLKLRRCVTCQRLRQRIRAGWTWEEALANPGPIPQNAPTKRRWRWKPTNQMSLG